MTDNNHDSMMMAIGRLEGKMDGIVTQMSIANGRTSKLEARIDNSDKRIDSLEKTREQGRGMKASWRELLGWITGLGGVAVAFLTWYLSRK